MDTPALTATATAITTLVEDISSCGHNTQANQYHSKEKRAGIAARIAKGSSSTAGSGFLPNSPFRPESNFFMIDTKPRPACPAARIALFAQKYTD